MPSRSWHLRIEDILEAIERIQQYTANLDEESFEESSLVTDAVIRNLIIVGEAANHVPEAIRARYPDVPWSKMRGMRNMNVHEYFADDAVILWSTIKDDLPPLVPLLQTIIAREPDVMMKEDRSSPQQSDAGDAAPPPERIRHCWRLSQPPQANPSTVAAPPSRALVATVPPARRAL